jgi:hypothetical protein
MLLVQKLIAQPIGGAMARTPEPKHISLEEFQSDKVLSAVTNLVDQINGGSFMECHQAIYAATGIWVDELVPVFQKLDAALATRDLRVRQ